MAPKNYQTKKLKSKLKKILNDFSQPSGKLLSGIFNDFVRYRVPGSYDKLRLTRFLFDDILGFEIADRPMEKINWEIPFIYKQKYICSIAHQKFGFRVYVSDKNTKNPERVAKEIIAIIEKALDESEPLIKQYATTSLEKGQISIDNRFHELKRVYDYFKREISKRREKMNEISASDSASESLQDQFKLKQEISYLEQAGYVAFYSLLEHLCVLFFSFQDASTRENVKDFARKIWSDKFKVVFDLSQPEFKEIYDYLLDLSRYKRNPSVHGLFDKLHSIFNFYLPSARHRISLSLYDRGILLEWRNEELNFNKLDGFLQLLSTHSSTKRKMRYLDMDFNVVFDKSVQDFDSFTDEEFEQFLEYEARSFDDLMNMDW